MKASSKTSLPFIFFIDPTEAITISSGFNPYFFFRFSLDISDFSNGINEELLLFFFLYAFHIRL